MPVHAAIRSAPFRTISAGTMHIRDSHRAVRRRSARRSCTANIHTRAAASFADGYFDFVYLDGNHHYEFVLQDLQDFAAKLKPGGLLFGHDFFEDAFARDEHYGVDRCRQLVREALRFPLPAVDRGVLFDLLPRPAGSTVSPESSSATCSKDRWRSSSCQMRSPAITATRHSSGATDRPSACRASSVHRSSCCPEAEVAERVGFEPTVGLHPRRFSRPLP